MPLLKSRKKTSELFSKTIKSLQSMLAFHHGGDGQAIDTRPACHPFSCSRRKIPGQDAACCSIKQQKKIIDEFYSDRWMMADDDQGYEDHDLIISTSMQDKVIVVSSSHNTNEQCLKTKKHQQQDAEKREMNKQGGIRSSSCRRVISERMKELEMMEFKDVEHVLDVEEVLHYYSRLRSPVYLDIVDSFFTDMYTELLHKPRRGCSRGSKRRPLGLGPLKKLQET